MILVSFCRRNQLALALQFSFKGNISELSKDAGKSHLLEVHVSYANNLRDLHNDLLFMCKKRKVNGV